MISVRCIDQWEERKKFMCVFFYDDECVGLVWC